MCAVPKHGTCRRRYLSHTPANIAYFGWRCCKGSMDAGDSRGYLFHNVNVTESFGSSGVELGSLPLPIQGLGEGTKLGLVRSLDLRGWALLGAAALCIVLPGMVTQLGGSA